MTEKTINFGITINLTDYQSLRIDLIGYSDLAEIKSSFYEILIDLAQTDNEIHKKKIMNMIDLIIGKGDD